MSAILQGGPGNWWREHYVGRGRRREERTQADEIGAPMEDRSGTLECLFGHA